MLGHVHAGDFLIGGDTQEAEGVEAEEEWAHGARHPGKHDQDLDQLADKQVAAAAVEGAEGGVREADVGLVEECVVGKEAWRGEGGEKQRWREGEGRGRVRVVYGNI